MKHPFITQSVACLFHEQIYKHHGLPQSIISDQAKIFFSHMCQELFRLADDHLSTSSVYHPQTDGQTGRVNQCLETFLRCFVHACPTQWNQWFSVARFLYDSSPHSSTCIYPFEAMYGCRPRQFGITEGTSITSTDLASWLHNIQLM